MSLRPEPPSSPDSAEELLQSVQDNPEAWMFYLREINQHATIQTELAETNRLKAEALATTVGQHEAVIRYQKEQLQEERGLILRLEREKIQLATAAAPAVQTSPNEPMPPLQVTAKDRSDHAAREATPATTPRSETASLSERHPDPDKFDGSSQDLRRFTAQVSAKMTANADRFPTTTSRLIYVAGRLSGKAYDLILPRAPYGIPQFTDYPELLRFLEAAYGDPDRIQNARNRLYTLRQGNKEFSSYFAEFERLALEGEMPEASLQPLLFQNISRELQDMLLHSPAPTWDFRPYARHLQTLDNRYRQHQQQVNRHKWLQRNRATPLTPPPPEPKNPSLKLPAAETGDPMDLSHQRSRPRSPNGRKERGECFRCGQKGHLVAQCPEPDRRPVPLRHARTSSPQGSPLTAPSVTLPSSQLPLPIQSPLPAPYPPASANRFSTLRTDSPPPLNTASLY